MTSAEEICPYCSVPVSAGPEGLRCRACGARHHRDCWQENGGCAVVGCDEVAQATARDLPTAKAPPGGEWPSEDTAPPPRISGGAGKSLLPWVVLLLAGMAGVVVVTLLVLGGDGESDSGSLLPLDPPWKKGTRERSTQSARELLEEQGYLDCGGEAFRRDASPQLCAAVATEVRLDPRGGLYPGIVSAATGYAYDMECRPGNTHKVLQRFLFCAEVGTTNPDGVSAGGGAFVVVGT